MAEDTELIKTKITSCFMHFEGVVEPHCNITARKLKKFIECSKEWVKLNGEQAEIAKRSYSQFEDDIVNSHLDETFDKGLDINLEWYHHAKCYKKFCDKDKIRRKQKKQKDLDLSKPSSNGASASDEPKRKFTRLALQSESSGKEQSAQRNKFVLPERCIICEKDSSWFSKNKVSYSY